MTKEIGTWLGFLIVAVLALGALGVYLAMVRWLWRYFLGLCP